MGTNDWKSTCTHLMWSIFRTHDKMAEFDDVNFEDHPAIASEYIKFLACNLGFDMLETTGNGDMWYRAPYNRIESGYRESFLYLDLTKASWQRTKSRGIAAYHNYTPWFWTYTQTSYTSSLTIPQPNPFPPSLPSLTLALSFSISRKQPSRVMFGPGRRAVRTQMSFTKWRLFYFLFPGTKMKTVAYNLPTSNNNF